MALVIALQHSEFTDPRTGIDFVEARVTGPDGKTRLQGVARVPDAVAREFYLKRPSAFRVEGLAPLPAPAPAPAPEPVVPEVPVVVADTPAVSPEPAAASARLETEADAPRVAAPKVPAAKSAKAPPTPRSKRKRRG